MIPSHPRYILFLLFLGALSVLIGALYFQYGEGLHPCRLCLLQRWPWVAVMGLSLVGLVWGRFSAVFLAISGLVLVGGALLAGYHAGLEQGWWANALACDSAIEGETLDQLLENLKNQPFVPCDKIPWSFLGLSMAAWNALLSLMGAVVSLKTAKFELSKERTLSSPH